MATTPEDRWERVSTLFADALDRPAAERTAWLDAACDDPAVRAEVKDLLAAQPEAESGFEALGAAAGQALAAFDTLGVGPPRTPPPGPGETVGHYRIEAALGAGGMGSVWRAFDRRLERPVALKFLHADLDDAARARLLREARAAAALDHPHVCTVHGVEEVDGRTFLVMACYEGETLRVRLARGPLGRDEALAVAADVADALEAAHAAGVVHRDLKPGNVMLTRAGVRVLDFGIAHLARAERLTRTGAALGTVGYMAPEQVRGEAVGPAADLWALGVLLVEMRTGARPFQRDTEASVLYAVLESEPDGLGRLDPDERSLVRRLLAKRPEDRPASAGDVRDALRAGGIGVKLAPPQQHVTRRWAVWLTGIALLALGAWLAWPAARPPAATQPMTLAVLPFEVRGGDALGYLREGLVDLLATQLDGVAGIRVVDPNALLSQARSDGPLSLDEARALAAGFASEQFVLGRVMDTGGGLRLHASLYETGGAEAARAQASAASPEDLLPALDALAQQLVAAQLGDPDEQLAGLAALTTTSFPALRAYLDGEQLLRDARFAEAEVALSRAVEADSLFALAWYRLARAAGWTGNGYLNQRAVARALRHAEDLPARTRDVLAGYHAFRTGRPAEAERRYRSVLARHPDDAETWLLLTEVLFHYNPYRGRPVAEAREPLTQARRWAPDNRELLVHSLDFSLQRGDAAALDSFATVYLTGGPSPAMGTAYGLMRDLAIGAVAASAVPERLRSAGLDVAVLLLTRLAPLAGDEVLARTAAEVLASSDDADARATGLLHLASFDAAAGRWAESERHFADAQVLDPDQALTWRTLVAALPNSSVPDRALPGLRAGLEAWTPAAVAYGGEGDAVRRYLLGLLDVRLGQPDRARGAARSLETDDTVLARALAASLRARAEFAADPEAALARIDAVRLSVPFPLREVSPVYGQVLDRAVCAEALRLLGRTAAAERWQASLHDGYEHVPFVAPQTK
ncbi:MAG: protein kinase [Bacteroidota bacterium]